MEHSSQLASRYQARIRPQWARPIHESSLPFRPVQARGAAQKRGVNYEKKVSHRLIELYALEYIPSVWFVYGESGRTRYCQVDGLLILNKTRDLILVECKYSHTPDAYWQCENLYLPVLRAWLGNANEYWSISVCEIVKWYDPHTQFPTRPRLVERLELVRPHEFNVHILNRLEEK